tara:strand:+ start:1028 stop:1345 length:318 start_codon:yes stop_codon:yes gene_type:complete
MFQKVHVPIMGMIENMSHFVCPKCDDKTYIFGEGGCKKVAEELGMDFLGEVPLHLAIRETSDHGNPITISSPTCPQAEAYRAIARKIVDKLDSREGSKGPTFSVE